MMFWFNLPRVSAWHVSLVMALLVCAPTHAAEYYVDNEHPGAGDDNPGTQGEPWTNCPDMPGWTGSAILQPGDVVHLHNERTWEFSSGVSILQAAGGVTYDGSSWGSGTRATLRATGTIQRSVINFMQDHATEPTVVCGFDVDVNDQVMTGIAINWPSPAGDLTGAVKRIENCVVHDVYSHSADSQWEYGILVSSGTEGSSVANVEILDCTAYNISRGGINAYCANDDPTNTIENVLVRGCEIYATGTDPDYGGSALPMKNHVINAVYEYNYVHDTTNGFGTGLSSHNESFRGPENAVIRHNIFRNAVMGIVINVKGDLSVDIYGNIIMDNVGGGGFSGHGIMFMDVQDDIGVRILNNTLIHNYSETWSHEILVQAGSANFVDLQISNNLIFAQPGSIPLQDDAGSITAHSNNLFYVSDDGTLVRSAGTNYTAADIDLWEPSAVAAEPGLQDMSDAPTGFIGSYGLDLRPDTEGCNLLDDSPARDSGGALDAAYSSSINSVARPSDDGWDIGAYEVGIPDGDADADSDADGDADSDVDGDADGGEGAGEEAGCGCRAVGRRTSIAVFMALLI